jgi:hypothetical protein
MWQNVYNLEISIGYCYSILNMSIGLPIPRIKCGNNILCMFDCFVPVPCCLLIRTHYIYNMKPSWRPNAVVSVSLGSQLCEYGVGVQCSGGWLAVSIIRVDTSANISAPVYQTTRRHIPEDHNLHTDCPENLSCYAVYLSSLG